MSRKMNKWRLPTIEELEALVDHNRCTSSSTDQEMKGDFYWSSTTDAPNVNYAWQVYFCVSSTGNDRKTDTFYVRCVRDTKNELEWSETADEKMTWDEAIKYVEDMNKEIA